jgi:hypothetical protein
MNDKASPESDRERNARAAGHHPIPAEPTSAYALGYADGRRLLKSHEPANESVTIIRARYLAHVEANRPTFAERAYVAGVRDAAADNLPYPPTEPDARAHRHAA